MRHSSVAALSGTSRLLRLALVLGLALAAVVPIAPLRTEVARASGNDGRYFADTPTWYRDYAPGTINPNEGTVEMTLRIDKPYSEFGNNWDFVFYVVPEQAGPGNTLIAAHIPPPQAGPSNGSYELPLTFQIRNGAGSAIAYSYAQPASLNYAPGQPFNLALTWKLGPGGYLAIYKDGVELTRLGTSIDPIQEKFMPYEFMVDRGAPYNVSSVKISTKALTAGELGITPDAFAAGTDTALLASIASGTPIQAQRFATPWQTGSGYSVVKPAYRADKQVFSSGETAVYPVTTINFGSADKTYTATIKATDPYGNTVIDRPVSISVPADATYRTQELALPELNGLTGYWDIETTVSSASGGSIVYKSAITKGPGNDASVPDGPYADYLGAHADNAASMSGWAKIGANTVRAWGANESRAFLWHKIEPVQGQFQWDDADAYVNEAMSNGLDVLGVLGYPSNWASSRPPVSGLPTEIRSYYQYFAERYVSNDILSQNGVPGAGADWTDYVYRTMKRYAGKVKYYEIVNEVNFHPPMKPAAFSGTEAEYFKMLKIAHEQAERVKTEYKTETGRDLELYLTSSGFTSIGGTDGDRQMAVNALHEPYAGYYDIYNIHGYSGATALKDDVLQAFRQAKQRHPNLQLWQGEYGPLNETYASNSAKLYQLVQNYTDFASRGFDRYFAFGTGDDTFTTRNSYSPTPTFQTLAVLQNQFRKVESYQGAYSGFPNEALLSVKHRMLRTDGNSLSILSSDSRPLHIRIANANKIISVTDNYGNPVPVQAGGDVYKKDTVFIVSSEPLSIAAVDSESVLPLLPNGDFEQVTGDPMGGPGGVTPDSWLMGWNRGTYGTNAYVTKTLPYQGSYTLEFNSATAPGNRTFMYQKVSLPSPGTYELTAEIKKVQGGPDVQPELNIWDGANDHQLAPVTLTNQYAHYSKLYYTAQPTEIIVNVGILSGNGVVDFDNVTLTKVSNNIELAMDNSDETGVSFTNGNATDAWDNTKANSGANLGNFALNTSNDGKSSVTYTPTIPVSGMYDVYEWHHPTSGTTAAPFVVKHARGTSQVLVGQTVATGGKWNRIGNFPFEAGSTGSVAITNGFGGGTGNFVLADGLKFVRTDDIPPMFGNGDFEKLSGNPLDGTAVFQTWSPGAGSYGENIIVRQSAPYQGAYAAEFNTTASGNGGSSLLTQTFAVLEPGTYTLSGYIRKLEGGADVQPELAVLTGTGEVKLEGVVPTGNYAYYALTVDIAQRTNVTVKAGIRSGAGRVAIDNIGFAKLPGTVEIIMDNKDSSGVAFSDATWLNTGANASAYNGDFALNTAKNGKATATYTPAIPVSGMYDVYEWHHYTSGPTDAPFTVHSAEGSTRLLVDQSKNGQKWNKIGTFPFLAGSTGSVDITNGNTTSSFILADGIRFVRTGPYAPIALDHVVLSADQAVLGPGQTARLAVAGVRSDGSPADLSGASIAYASDSPVALVDEQGYVVPSDAAEGPVHLTVTVTLATGAVFRAGATIVVDHSPPVLAWTGETSYTIDQEIVIGCAANDALGEVVFTTCGSGASLSAPAYAMTLGAHAVQASAIDAAGNEAVSSFAFIIAVDFDSLSALTAKFAGENGETIVQALRQKLTDAEAAAAAHNGTAARQRLAEYVALLTAQPQSDVLTVAQQDILTRWAQELSAATPLAGGAPGKPIMTDTNGYGGLRDGNYTVAMDMWWGNNGTQFKLYENGHLIAGEALADASPDAQHVATAVTGKPNGTYVYTCELSNAYGTTACDPLTVVVTDADPGKPQLSNDNWDHNGDYRITMNMWWGTNAMQYKLYENDRLIDTKSLDPHTPGAQTAFTALTDRAPGVYRYRAELTNAAGMTVSDEMEVTVQ